MTAAERDLPDGMPSRLSFLPLPAEQSFSNADIHAHSVIGDKIDAWMNQDGMAQTLRKLTMRRGAGDMEGTEVGRIVRWEDLQEER